MLNTFFFRKDMEDNFTFLITQVFFLVEIKWIYFLYPDSCDLKTTVNCLS